MFDDLVDFLIQYRLFGILVYCLTRWGLWFGVFLVAWHNGGALLSVDCVVCCPSRLLAC